MKRGYTLVELLACLALVALLAAIAIPSWQATVTRAQRADGKAALLALAAAQERYRFVHGRYADAAAPAPPDGLGLASSERGWYELRIDHADEHRFTASAVPGPGSPQQRDVRCLRLAIDETGARGAVPGPVERCWR